ncbi:hypothetical protein G3I61_20900 [Streptomyces diastaticus]|nr:hypothetical protein [Streptomyces diastaticus]
MGVAGPADGLDGEEASGSCLRGPNADDIWREGKCMLVLLSEGLGSSQSRLPYVPSAT